MLSRVGASVSRLPVSRVVLGAPAAAARFSTPAEDAAAKMTFGVKSATVSAAKANNAKQFKIYRWNPDTKGTNADCGKSWHGFGHASRTWAHSQCFGCCFLCR